MNAYEKQTQAILAKIKEGTAPWKKPFSGGMPRNLVSGKEYQGGNLLFLMTVSQGHSSQYFLTYRQAKKLGGAIKKGSKGYPIIFFKMVEKKDQPDEYVPLVRHSYVFNLDQTEGIEPPEAEAGEAMPRADLETFTANLLANMAKHNARPEVRLSTRASYMPGQHIVNMPDISGFDNTESYYSIFFHELAHSTKRVLARPSSPGNVNSPAYALEELTAELTAFYLCGKAGISPATEENNAAYLSAWHERLSNDPKLFYKAAKQAEKAAELLLNGNLPEAKEKPAEPKEQAA